MKAYEGKGVHKDGNDFRAFAANMHSIGEVMTVYKQIKYRFMDTSHVMCAYRILDPDVAHMQDCADGGEIGAGWRLLKMMMEKDFANLAVFVV